jgi:hypothetical protein
MESTRSKAVAIALLTGLILALLIYALPLNPIAAFEELMRFPAEAPEKAIISASSQPTSTPIANESTITSTTLEPSRAKASQAASTSTSLPDVRYFINLFVLDECFRGASQLTIYDIAVTPTRELDFTTT